MGGARGADACPSPRALLSIPVYHLFPPFPSRPPAFPLLVFNLHLLGDPALRGPDGLVTGRAAYRRRIALLSILAVARGRPVGRERIIGLLWPEHSADAARHSLSESLYVLRKDLAEDLFVAVGDEVALNRAVMTSDVAEFEEAVEALRPEDAVRAYGGPLLDGFYVSDAAEFERWVDGERDRLARVHAQTLERLATSTEAAGDAHGAAEWWRRLAAQDPFSSRVALRLVSALDAAGDRMAALRFAATHASLMREELGADPDPELARLVERLRAEPLRVPPLPAAPAPAAVREAADDREAAPGAENGDAVAGAPAVEPRAGGEADGIAAGAEREEDAGADLVDADSDPADADSAVAGVPDAAPAPGALEMEDEADPASGDGDSPGGTAEVRAGEPAGEPLATALHARGASAPAELVPAAGAPEVAGVWGDGERGGTVAGERARGHRRHARWAGSLAAAAVVALVLAVAMAVARGGGEEAPRYDPRRIAVLYLDDNSPGGELGYLASGLTEMLIHELSGVEALNVVSRNGVKPYRDNPVPFARMAADLRAGSVVEGSVQRSGDSVRVVIQLIDANTGAHLESRSLVRPLDPGGLFTLQDEVAAEVAAFLRRRVGREIRLSSLRSQTTAPHAFDLVLRASQARADAREMARSQEPRDVASSLRMLAAADTMLAQAARLDPRWAEPVLQRGWGEVERGRMLPPPAAFAAFRTARDHGAAVLRHQPGSVDGRELLGTALWQMVTTDPARARGTSWLADAERELRAVVQAEPQRAAAWSTLGQLLRLGGDLAEAELAARRAREQDAYLDVPDVGAELLYRAALALGDVPRARHWCAEGLRRFPADYRFRECGLLVMVRDLSAVPSPDSAWRLVAEADRVDPPAAARAAGRPYSPIFRRMMAAAALARAGLPDSARAVAGRARRLAAADPVTQTSFLWDDAFLHVQLGDSARAAALLRAFVARRPPLRDYVAREPAFRGVWLP